MHAGERPVHACGGIVMVRGDWLSPGYSTNSFGIIEGVTVQVFSRPVVQRGSGGPSIHVVNTSLWS